MAGGLLAGGLYTVHSAASRQPPPPPVPPPQPGPRLPHPPPGPVDWSALVEQARTAGAASSDAAIIVLRLAFRSAESLAGAMEQHPWAFRTLAAVVAMTAGVQYTTRQISVGMGVLWSCMQNLGSVTLEGVWTLWEWYWDGNDPALADAENRRLEAIARRVSNLRNRWYSREPPPDSALTAELFAVGDQVVQEILGLGLDSQNMLTDRLLDIQSVQDFTIAGFAPGYVDSPTTRKIVALLCNQYVASRARLLRATPAGAAQKAGCDRLWLDAFGEPPLPQIDFEGFAGQVIPWLDAVEKRFRQIRIPQLTSPQPTWGDQDTAQRQNVSVEIVTRQRLARERAEQIKSVRMVSVAQYQHNRLHSPSAYELFSGRHARHLGMSQQQRMLNSFPRGRALSP